MSRSPLFLTRLKTQVSTPWICLLSLSCRLASISGSHLQPVLLNCETGTCTKPAGDHRLRRFRPFRQIVGSTPSQASPYRRVTSASSSLYCLLTCRFSAVARRSLINLPFVGFSSLYLFRYVCCSSDLFATPLNSHVVGFHRILSPPSVVVQNTLP